MAFSRRSFFQRVATGAGAAAVLQLPLAERLLASPEPQRHPLAKPGQIRINSNENAYGPLPRAAKAMQTALLEGNRYPDFRYTALTSTIAKYHKISEDQLLLGCGSTELLRVCAQTFAGPGKNVIVADPTFETLANYGATFGYEARKVPLAPNFAHDLDAMLAKVDSNTGLIYICNPNNPTASITPASDIETFLQKVPSHVTVLIDEAYHHFADGEPGYASFLEKTNDRLVVLRTFSKIYGMAGMRLGFGVSSPATIKKMSTARLEINVNAVSAAGGVASLEDDASMVYAQRRNAIDRQEFLKEAASRNVNVIPSFANFYMVKTGRPAKDVITAFETRNVLIGRPFPPMLDYVRVSLGIPAEMKIFWAAWDDAKI